MAAAAAAPVFSVETGIRYFSELCTRLCINLHNYTPTVTVRHSCKISVCCSKLNVRMNYSLFDYILSHVIRGAAGAVESITVCEHLNT